VQDGAADLQHGIEVYRDSDLCIKGHSPRVRVFAHKNPLLIFICCMQLCIHTVNFFPLQVKNKPHGAVMTVFILGPVSTIVNNND
jgi:hypothetical protein